MLTGARNEGEGGVGLKADSPVDTFRGGITTACVIDKMNIAEIGGALYQTERARFAPP